MWSPGRDVDGITKEKGGRWGKEQGSQTIAKRVQGGRENMARTYGLKSIKFCNILKAYLGINGKMSGEGLYVPPG